MVFRIRGRGTTCAIFGACFSWIAIGCGPSTESLPETASGPGMDGGSEGDAAGTPDVAADRQPEIGDSRPDGTVDEHADSEPDANICNCMPGSPLDCFFDADGGRPASDVGLADQICGGSFPVRDCVDNVEVFHYENCNRTEVRVSGCFAGTEFLFDAATHALVGASYGSDTNVECRATGERILRIEAGERLPASCVMSSCSLECRIIGGIQFPTCIVPDAADADAPIDASDAAPLRFTGNLR